MNINEIDYEHVKAQLKSFLKNHEKFKDFNFEASGISTLINLLAYNTHYLGAYMFAVNNESSIDSAQSRQSIYSKSRGLGYTPKGMKSSIVEVVFKTEVEQFPREGFVILHAGKGIIATSNRESKQRTFTNVDNVYLYDWVKLPNGNFEFRSKPTIIYEGSFVEWEFVVDRSIKYQHFIIKDDTIDIDTLRVFVKTSDSDEGEQFHHAHSMFDINHSSKCFYTSITQDGFVEIFFGNDVFGEQPADGRIITCKYMSTIGELGNGCTHFKLPGFIVEAAEVSNSGSDGETLETTRFNAINHFKAQNRLITPDDYRSLIMQHFRNIQAINVWRGEDNYIKQYGKIFVSVKPHYTDKLSDSAKRHITQKLVDKTKQLGADPVFVDADFIECDIDIILTTALNNSSVSVELVNDKAIKAAQQYNDNQLNVFNNSLSDVELNDRIRRSSSYIQSSFTRKKLRKICEVDLSGISSNRIYFGNSIVAGSVNAKYQHNGYTFTLSDVDGVINCNVAYTRSDGVEISKYMNCGTVDYKEGLIEFTHQSEQQGFANVEFTVTPKNPDINSTFNNIVRISNLRIAYD